MIALECYKNEKIKDGQLIDEIIKVMLPGLNFDFILYIKKCNQNINCSKATYILRRGYGGRAYAFRLVICDKSPINIHKIYILWRKFLYSVEDYLDSKIWIEMEDEFLMSRKIGVELNKVNNPTDLDTNLDKVFIQLKDTIMNNMTLDKAKKLTFWLNEWGADYLKNEKTFSYLDLLRYDRGCVVEADLGFKIGSEQGGLHYCIVLDHKNAKSSKVLMVIPLESLPDHKKPEDIDENYEVFLGYGIFKDDIAKIEGNIKDILSKIEVRKNKGLEFSKLQNSLSKLKRELTKLKKGSVAQIGQMCALSKMRIYSPKKKGDKFSTFKLDDDKMKEIEDKIAYLYFQKFLEKK